MLQHVNNHPVHILNENGEISPSAFIPFCSFGEDLNQVGTENKLFDIPVCRIFESVIWNDQLCYKADLDKFRNSKDLSKLRKQFEIGLVLLLDHNEENQLEIGSKEKDPLKENVKRIFNKNYGNPASIHMNTISRLKSFLAPTGAQGEGM